MLAQATAQDYGKDVRLVAENFGESELAERFGVKRYPAIFVNDVLVARPIDFGFYGSTGSHGKGRYTPWLQPDNQRKFLKDLKRCIDLARRGKVEELADMEVVSDHQELVALPAFEAETLKHGNLKSEALKGKRVIVEFWAAWCPPCLHSLSWLSEFAEAYPDDLSVVSVAVESRREKVASMAEELPFAVIFDEGSLAATFGDVLAVPAIFLFDEEGKTIDVFYGDPPDVERRVRAWLKGSPLGGDG